MADERLASKVKAFNLEGSIFQWANEKRPMVDYVNQPTIFAHPYHIVWGKLLHKDLRRYDTKYWNFTAIGSISLVIGKIDYDQLFDLFSSVVCNHMPVLKRHHRFFHCPTIFFIGAFFYCYCNDLLKMSTMN